MSTSLSSPEIVPQIDGAPVPMEPVSMPGLSEAEVQFLQLSLMQHPEGIDMPTHHLHERTTSVHRVRCIGDLLALPSKKLEIALGHFRRSLSGILS